MKKTIYVLLTFLSLASAAETFRFPQTGFPAIILRITPFTDDNESIIYSGRLDAQVLCLDGRKFNHKFADDKNETISKICQFERPIYYPNGTMKILIGVPDMSKAHSPCSKGFSTTFTKQNLEDLCRVVK